jgi:hypothetical protein
LYRTVHRAPVTGDHMYPKSERPTLDDRITWICSEIKFEIDIA